MDSGIRLENVSFTYPGKASPALDGVYLEIPPGTLAVVVGASGSGKSTLCYTFNGAIPHVIPGELTGRVAIDGLATREYGLHLLAQRVGLVFQDPETMFANLVVADEIAFGPANLGWSRQVIASRVRELIEYVGLGGLDQRTVWDLSGGQVQRVALAAVLAMRPSAVVLDEPTSNLDPAARLKVYELAHSLRSEGATVVVVTKELDELLPFADLLVVMDSGRVAHVGPARPVLDSFGAHMRELGIWLPEVVELGLALRERTARPALPLPCTVAEAVRLVEESGEFPPDPSVPAVDLPAAPTAPVVISAKNVAYAYPGAEMPAVSAVSFEVRAGEMVAILGRNGAGKSTLAKMMMGLIKPTAGELRVAGTDVARSTPQALARQIGFVFQNPEHQFVTDTVYDELAYGLIARRAAEAEIREQVEAMIRLMDLEDVRRDHPFGLSAGKKRRLGVATMLISQPAILVVDEPTYGQDRAMTESLMETMLGLRKAGTTVLMITHDMRLVESYIPRSIVMAEGCVLFDGPTPALFSEEEVLRQASLRVTSRHELIGRLRAGGRLVPAGLFGPAAVEA